MKFRIQRIPLKTAAILLLFSCNPLASWTQVSPKSDDAFAPPDTANWKITRHGGRLIRINPDANLSLYNGITVGNVSYTGPVKALRPRESDKLANLLRQSLVADLAGAKFNQDTAATETLTLHANITRVKRSHPWVNVVTMAAVVVPLDLGTADVTAWIIDPRTGLAVAAIETKGCGQIYQAWPSLQPLGQSKLALKKDSRWISKEVNRMNWNEQLSRFDASPVPYRSSTR